MKINFSAPKITEFFERTVRKLLINESRSYNFEIENQQLPKGNIKVFNSLTPLNAPREYAKRPHNVYLELSYTVERPKRVHATL
jgi:hypothetical protein